MPLTQNASDCFIAKHQLISSKCQTSSHIKTVNTQGTRMMDSLNSLELWQPALTCPPTMLCFLLDSELWVTHAPLQHFSKSYESSTSVLCALCRTRHIAVSGEGREQLHRVDYRILQLRVHQVSERSVQLSRRHSKAQHYHQDGLMCLTVGCCPRYSMIFVLLED